jgi:hypothetical protein
MVPPWETVAAILPTIVRAGGGQRRSDNSIGGEIA